MDTIRWGGKTVPRTYKSYCSRQEMMTAGGGRFNHQPTLIPAEYAVRDQQGFIFARFPTQAEADTYADEHNKANQN